MTVPTSNGFINCNHNQTMTNQDWQESRVDIDPLRSPDFEFEDEELDDEELDEFDDDDHDWRDDPDKNPTPSLLASWGLSAPKVIDEDLSYDAERERR